MSLEDIDKATKHALEKGKRYVPCPHFMDSDEDPPLLDVTNRRIVRASNVERSDVDPSVALCPDTFGGYR